MDHRQELAQADTYHQLTGGVADVIMQMPEVPIWLVPWWQAYRTMAGSRAVGLAAGPVPLSEIRAYCDLFGITDPDDIEDLVYIVGEMDDELLQDTPKE